MRNKSSHLRQILAALTNVEGTATLAVLRNRVSTGEVNCRQHKEEFDYLLGLAHHAFLNLDPRATEHAIECYARCGALDALEDLKRLAYRHGHFRLAWFIEKKLNLPNWKEQFASWFEERGIWWFDLFTDGACCYIHPDDVSLIEVICEELSLGKDFWNRIDAAADEKQLPSIRCMLMKKFAQRDFPIAAKCVDRVVDVDGIFRRYIRENDALMLRQLQKGKRGAPQCSWVYLVLDTDGIVKIFKELIESDGRIEHDESEVALYDQLKECDFLPKPYGVVDLGNGIRFMRQPFLYGMSLSEYVSSEKTISVDEACVIIGKAARKLAELHRNGIAHLDLKPDHLRLCGNEVNLLDLGLSRKVCDLHDVVDVYVHTPRYGAPEMVLQGKGSCATDIFQLGIIFHELLIGQHPFCLHPQLTEGDEVRASEIIKYALPIAALSYDDCDVACNDQRIGILKQMLARNPLERPLAKEIAEVLLGNCSVSTTCVAKRKHPQQENTVLFPARMGIPHHGHIEYMARIIELGYYLKISLQHSYTLTERDPLEKWIVMKMVARSLVDRGISPDNFEFLFTPLYWSERELKMHFYMMPGWNDVMAIASGNPEVHQLFPEKLILDQKAVFGSENEAYDVRSWGQLLRDAALGNDYVTFGHFAASGVEKILSFQEIKTKMRNLERIEFISGKVRLRLSDSLGEYVTEGRAYRYLPPEESICRHLQQAGYSAHVCDPYAKSAKILLDGKPMQITYCKTEFDGVDELIYFQLEEPD